MYDVSLILTAHREGRLAHHTMKSLQRSWEHARSGGMAVELVVVMDRPDQATKRYFSRYSGDPDIQMHAVSVGDPGLARNAGVEKAKGECIAILDADNLVGENWLHAAWTYLQDKPAHLIAHPEFQLIFEERQAVFRQISMDDPRFKIRDIIEYNYWDTMCMAGREVFLTCPYEETMQGKAFGYEDWHWNCQTIAEGYVHHVVPGTVHFMRSKRTGSNFMRSVETTRIIRPSKLFEPEVFKKAIEKYDHQ